MIIVLLKKLKEKNGNVQQRYQGQSRAGRGGIMGKAVQQVCK